MFNHPHVLVVGASGRFLAQSALLSGCKVSVIDLFGDVDTRQLCAASEGFSTDGNSGAWARKIEALGDLAAMGENGRVRLLEELSPKAGAPSLVIVFAGGAENYPRFFDSAFWGRATVAGPSEKSIAALLQWPTVERVCRTHQIPTPRSCGGRLATENLSASTTWLRKRERSGGGLQIQHWDGAEPAEIGEGFYLQESIEGATVSGCFISSRTEGRSSTRLLGVCRQLNNPMNNPKPDDYRYRGSTGPIQLDEGALREVERAGYRIAAEFGIEGVWGIDFISNKRGLYLIDINPRITASAELIQRYYRRSQAGFTILAAHLEATQCGRLPTPLSTFGDRLFSKTILYWESDAPLVVNEALVEFFQRSSAITDIPGLGTEIQPGHPLVTVHCEGENQADLETEARKHIKQVRQITAMANSSADVGNAPTRPRGWDATQECAE